MTAIHYPAFAYDDDPSWLTLSACLERQVRIWVYTHRTSRWRGEEEEAIKDIVSESVTRTLIRLDKARRGVDDPVISIYGFARQTAHNYLIDLVRKEHGLLRFSQLGEYGDEPALKTNAADMEEIVHNAVYNEQLFKLMAREIATFPKKQKEAILRDHAKLIDVMSDPTPLLRAYQSVGIQLQDYRNYIPMNCAEKRRHSSLLHHAYLRLSRSPALRQYYRQSA